MFITKKELLEYVTIADKSDNSNIVKSFEDQGHYKWFDYINPDSKFSMSPEFLEHALRKTLSNLALRFGYQMKRVVVKDKGQIVGFLIWSDKGSSLDNLGNNRNYQVILATAVHPEYRNRGLLKTMLMKSGIQKPYLVQTSDISPIGLWQKMGCKKVKPVGGGNYIERCN